MWPSNKDIPLFIRVPIIMNHRVYIVQLSSRTGSVVMTGVTEFGVCDCSLKFTCWPECTTRCLCWRRKPTMRTQYVQCCTARQTSDWDGDVKSGSIHSSSSCGSSMRLPMTATQSDIHTAAAPASEAEAVVRSPTNMAAAKIAAVDFNKMTSLDRPACHHSLRPCSLGKIC